MQPGIVTRRMLGDSVVAYLQPHPSREQTGTYHISWLVARQQVVPRCEQAYGGAGAASYDGRFTETAANSFSTLCLQRQETQRKSQSHRCS